MGLMKDMEKVSDEYRTGDRNYLEWLLGNTAATARAANEAVGTAIDYMVPDQLGIGSTIADIANYVANTDAGQYVSQKKKEFTEEYPVTSRMFGEMVDVASAAPIGRAIGRTDPAMRGIHTSSGDVIIDNYYNPRSKIYSEPVENMLQKISPDKVSPSGKEVYVKDNKTQNKIRKGMGMTQFLGRGLGRVAQNLINPYNRALYAEHGISPSYKYAYNKYLEADKKYKDALEAKVPIAERTKLLAKRNAAIEEAHSQMQQMGNIRQQAEAVARKNDATDPFNIAAASPSSPNYFNPAQVGSGKNWYWSTGAKDSNLRNIAPEESKFVQNHFEDTWLKGTDLNDVKVVVKKPHSQVTGDHFRDVIGRNSQVKHALDVFKNFKRRGRPEFETLDDLEAALKKKEASKIKVTGSKDKKKAFTVVGQDAGGVWIKMGKAGTAKVEGGVNMLIKIEPNGNVTGYMSDLHDFLEKVPGLGQGLAYSLPKKVLAVSPPMQSNVYTLMSEAKTSDIFGKAGMAKRKPIPSFPENERSVAVDRLNEAANIKPSTGELVRQTGQVAQNLSLFDRAAQEEEQ